MRENQYTTICNDPADALKLPEAPELERAVLGALLLEPQYVADVRGILTSTAFCNTQNAAIYDAICKLDDRGSTPDLFTVGQEAKKAGIPLSEVATLTQDVGSGVEILNHARILADLDMRRRLILWAEELKAKAQTDPDAVNWAMSGIERITGDVARIASARSIGDVMQDTLTDLERRQQAHQRGECVGISTGWPCMDRITGGWGAVSWLSLPHVRRWVKRPLRFISHKPQPGPVFRYVSFRWRCPRRSSAAVCWLVLRVWMRGRSGLVR